MGAGVAVLLAAAKEGSWHGGSGQRRACSSPPQLRFQLWIDVNTACQPGSPAACYSRQSTIVGEGVLSAVTTIAQDVIDARVQQWQLQQLQAQQAQQAGRRSPWDSLRGGGSLAPQQAQQVQQRGRARSADSYSGQQLPLDTSALGSRRRLGRHGGGSSSVRSASAGPTGREYLVRGSELGSQPGGDDEPSCCIS